MESTSNQKNILKIGREQKTDYLNIAVILIADCSRNRNGSRKQWFHNLTGLGKKLPASYFLPSENTFQE